MRRAISIFILSVALSFPVFASDTGTYRPGQAYNSITANSPMQCAAQCQGDAQCKGWNFVRPRQMSRTGLCEFNARRVSPVPSSVSISGDSATARASSRVIPSGTNTVRVGVMTAQPTQALPQVANMHRRQVSAPAVNAQAQVQKQIVAHHQPMLAGAPQTALRQSPHVLGQKPYFQYHLDGTQQRPQPVLARRPAAVQVAAGSAVPHPAHRFQHSLDGHSLARSAPQMPAVSN